MGNLLRKQKNTISELLFERGQLRNQVAEWKKKIDRSDELEKTNTILIEKMKQVMEDIRLKGIETSQAKTELSKEIQSHTETVKQMLDAKMEGERLKAMEVTYLERIKKLAEKNVSLQDDGIDKVRRRLQEQKLENDILRRRLQEQNKEIERLGKLNKYYERNKELEQPRAAEAIRDQSESE